MNSRTPLSLKLVNTDTNIAYIQLHDDREFATWTRHILHNLKMELTLSWKKDAKRLHHRMRQIAKAPSSTSVPATTTTA